MTRKKVWGHTCDRKNCGLTFYSNFYLEMHYKIHDNDVLRCPFCQFTGVGYHTLSIHMNTHFRNRPYKCSKCEEKFYTKKVKDDHEENIHERDGSKYQCSLCNYMTYGRTLLHYHLRSKHTE